MGRGWFKRGGMLQRPLFAAAPSRALVWIVLGVLAFRLVGLFLSPMNLHGDEAQYWSWSRQLEFGYFSKPPLIAWVIAATTWLFGDSEQAVRIAAPIAHALGALAIGAVAARLAMPAWRNVAALGAGLAYFLMPGVWLSSGVMSTDALMLPLWALALWFLLRFEESPVWARAIPLGIAVGLGFLAKYAMIYFVIGLLVAVLIRPALRTALVRPAGVLAGLIAGAIVAPNLIWNAANDFATVGHTAANANWGGPLFRPGKLIEFWGDQLGMFGPLLVLYVILFLAGWRRLDPADQRTALFLLAFIVPVFVVVSVQAFISRAHGNWAAGMYVGLSVLTGLALTWVGRRGLFRAGIILNALVGMLFMAVAVLPALADGLGLGNAFKRARGWDETTRAVAEAAGEAGYVSVLADNRLLFHALEFYSRRSLPLSMWQAEYPAAMSHAEARFPLSHGTLGPVLILNERMDEIGRLKADFASMELVGRLRIPLGGGRWREIDLYRGEGFAPSPRVPADTEAVAFSPGR